LVIADTGFWLALANRKDAHHAAARAALEGLREPLITTWPVMTETCHLLLRELGGAAQLAFLESLRRGAFECFSLSEEHAARIVQVVEKYKQLPMDLADASLVILAESLGHGRILSTDARDFHSYRWKNRRPFENLLVR
jgi:predicted nucleic acid-binding protein